MYEYVRTQATRTWMVILRTAQMAFLVLWLAHLLACGFFALGSYEAPGAYGAHWIDSVVPGTAHTIREAEAAYQYLSAYHWSVAQITLGGLDINPVNSAERGLAIACNVFGLLFGGTVVSLLATTMIELREINHDHTTKLRKLREFLMQHGCGLSIRLRVIRMFQDRVRHHEKTLVEKDVIALQALSNNLLRELRFDLFSSYVLTHPMLQSWTMLQSESIKHFCSTGITLQVLLPDDELFTPGTVASAAYVVKEGTVAYLQSPEDGIVIEEAFESLSEGAWLSEAVWWCYWFHVGTASANTHTLLLRIPPESVLETMLRDPPITAVALEYGVRFHEYLISNEDNPVSDANMQYVGLNGILCSLPKEMTALIGAAALQVSTATGDFGKLERTGDLKKLEDEVRHGMSVLVLDANRSLHRQVEITTLELRRGCEQFAEVAEFSYESQEWRAELQYPGVKQQRCEEHDEALRRIIRDHLALEHCEIPLDDLLKAVDVQDSNHYGINTRYVRSTYRVEVTEQIQDALARHVLRAKLGRHTPATPAFLLPHLQQQKYAAEELASATAQLSDVYLIQGPSKAGLYTWINKDDFHALKLHEASLQSLVAGLTQDIGQAEIEKLVTDSYFIAGGKHYHFGHREATQGEMSSFEWDPDVAVTANEAETNKWAMDL